jgi:L-malate glycosyltransferase
MRLLILSDTAAPHTRRWARWFALRGHDVHVVSFNPRKLRGYEPAVVHSVWKPVFGNRLIDRIVKAPIILARLRGLLRRRAIEVVHAHSAGGYAWTAMASGFRPYVVTPWGTDLLVHAQRSRINRWLTGLALRQASLVTTDGFHFVNILRGFGVAEGRILVHTFGTDVLHFCAGPDEGERQRLDIGCGPVIISTRTLNPVHDLESFVRALPKIHERFPDARFVIVGDGTDRARLERVTKELGMGALTRFTGMVEEDRMRRLLRASDVYVSTSKMDAGLAASTAEAMAIGLPVVQTDNSDNAHWTPDGEGGYLVANSDPAALADAVCRLLGDVEGRRKMGERNRRVIVGEYNIDTEMLRIETEYEKLLREAEHRR